MMIERRGFLISFPVEVRAVDPEHRFGNPHLERVLGA